MSDTAVARTVGDVMTVPVITALVDDTVAEAARRMCDSAVGAVVVVDAGRAVGILTERDLLRCAAGRAVPDGAKVGEWMTPSPDTCPPDLSVVTAVRELGKRHYRHLPVVSDGSLVGVVSLRDLLPAAVLEPVHEPGALEAPKGLAGVIVAETEVGDVRGSEGFYHYRQYDATELARHRSFEDVWYLMFEGTLPGPAERAAFEGRVNASRALPAEILDVLPAFASAAADRPLDALRTAVSHLAAAAGMGPSLDLTQDELRQDAERVCASVPTLVAALWRLGRGLEPIAPRADLGTAANYLYMVTGELPTEDAARAVEQYMITTVDHGFNASTFTARVVTSTGADLGAAVVAAIGALSGPLHGGAPSRALELLDEIGSPDRAEAVVRSKVSEGERIMGFGHRVYTTDDPRSVLLREAAERLGGDRVELATQVERTVVEVLADLKPGRELYANVEFYAGVVMERAGLPPELFTPTFASSRAIGWCANVLEQAADNRIIRPSARYVGAPAPEQVPGR